MSGQDDLSTPTDWESNARYWGEMAERYAVRMEQAAEKLQSLTRYKLELYGGIDEGGELIEDKDGHWLDADDVTQIIQDLEATNDTA